MSGRLHPPQALELLARESQVPVSEVPRLYEDARAELEIGARIKGFLGIFALRNVRKLLRQRRQLQASSLVLGIALAGLTGGADAGRLSSTGPVIAILAGEESWSAKPRRILPAGERSRCAPARTPRSPASENSARPRRSAMRDSCDAAMARAPRSSSSAWA